MSEGHRELCSTCRVLSRLFSRPSSMCKCETHCETVIEVAGESGLCILPLARSRAPTDLPPCRASLSASQVRDRPAFPLVRASEQAAVPALPWRARRAARQDSLVWSVWRSLTSP